MKKFIGIIILFLSVISVGCSKYEQEQREWKEKCISVISQYTNNVWYIECYRFSYNGHDYILFSNNNLLRGGVVHDPECPCHITQDTEIVNKIRGVQSRETSIVGDRNSNWYDDMFNY